MHKVAFPFCGSKARTSTCGRLVLYARRALFSRPSDARRAARIDRAIRAGLRATRIARAIRVGRRELTERFAASDANRQSDSRRAPRINRAIRVGRRESAEQSDPRRAPGGPGANIDQVGLHRRLTLTKSSLLCASLCTGAATSSRALGRLQCELPAEDRCTPSV
jgi:hypothetical protein